MKFFFMMETKVVVDLRYTRDTGEILSIKKSNFLKKRRVEELEKHARVKVRRKMIGFWAGRQTSTKIVLG